MIIPHMCIDVKNNSNTSDENSCFLLGPGDVLDLYDMWWYGFPGKNTTLWCYSYATNSYVFNTKLWNDVDTGIDRFRSTGILSACTEQSPIRLIVNCSENSGGTSSVCDFYELWLKGILTNQCDRRLCGLNSIARTTTINDNNRSVCNVGNCMNNVHVPGRTCNDLEDADCIFTTANNVARNVTSSVFYGCEIDGESSIVQVQTLVPPNNFEYHVGSSQRYDCNSTPETDYSKTFYLYQHGKCL